nr:urease accessory protein UreF [Tepidamorphus gemmatus]
MAEAGMAGSGASRGADAAALYRLMAWLSPAYPVGAFSHSHGLEWEVEAGNVCDAQGLSRWIGDILRHGGGRQDAILLAATWRAIRGGDAAGLAMIAELAAALSPSRERRTETLSQGRAFALATEAAWPAGVGEDPADLAYPVAVGLAAARHGIALEPALVAYLHAFAANLVSAGVRLVPLGQTDGQRAIARLEPVVAAVAAEAMAADLEVIGGCALLADIASMRHETQYTRLFRT